MKNNWWDLQSIFVIEETWKYKCAINEICSKRFYNFLLNKYLEITPEESYWSREDYKLKKIMYFLI